MESVPEKMTAEQFLADLETAQRALQANYETESNNLANLEQQEEDANDSIDLIEDDIHILFENPVPDILEYQALKADLHLTLDGLKEIEEAIKSKKAVIDKITEGLTKAEKSVEAMKEFIGRSGVVLPFKKEP